MPESVERKILYYRDANGNMPFREWMKSLKDKKTLAAILSRLDRVEKGLLGDCKFIESGVYELRIKHGAGYRIYFGQEGNQIVILLCGGDKSTQRKDIKRATEYWEDCQAGGKSNE